LTGFLAFGAMNGFNHFLFVGVKSIGRIQSIENIADIAARPCKPVK